MGAFARLGQVEAAAAKNDLLAEADEGGDGIAQPHLARLAAIECQHIHAEAGLQLGEAEELVQHHLGGGVTAQLDDDAHAGAVALVAHVADALDLFGADQFGDFLQQDRFVHLVGDFGDDDSLSAATQVLELGAGADDDAAAPGVEGRADAGAAEQDAAGGEIRRRHDLHDVFERDLGVVDHRQRGVDDLAGVVRRDVGGHADRDAAGAVDEQVGEGGGQDARFLVRLVVGRLEIDGVAVDVGEQEHRGARQPCLGVAHGRRRVAVDRAEIALAVDELHAHREGLRHTHQRVIDRAVAVRVEVAHHLADHLGAFSIRPVGGVAAALHGVEDAAVDGFQAVAGVWQGTADDHRHGVIEVGAAHLLLKDHRMAVPRGRHRGINRRLTWRCAFGGVAHVLLTGGSASLTGGGCGTVPAC